MTLAAINIDVDAVCADRETAWDHLVKPGGHYARESLRGRARETHLILLCSLTDRA